MTEDKQNNTQTLLKQFPQLTAHIGSCYLVKYGGAAMESPEVRKSVCDEIARLSILGIKIVVVHGGGKEISRTLERLGIESHFIAGLRVTTPETMVATEMVLSGAVNKDLASRITLSGAPAIGISGRDAHLFEAAPIRGPQGEDLGLAGEVLVCSSAPVRALLASGYVPVVSPIAETKDGTPLNVNADYAAAALAGALGVASCIFLTDVDGVRGNSGLEEALSPQEINTLISDGTIAGGMIPKVQCAVKAISSGCPEAIICNAGTPSIVSRAITRSAGGAGTAVISS